MSAPTVTTMSTTTVAVQGVTPLHAPRSRPSDCLTSALVYARLAVLGMPGMFW